MFTGTTPPEVRILLHDIMKGANTNDVFVGCSGNFTVDRIMSAMGFAVHSNDVSLYSRLIADLLLGKDTEIECVDKELNIAFESWEEGRFKKLAEVMFAMKVSQFHERKNDYQEEMYDAYLEQASSYYKDTVRTLEKAMEFKISDFYYGDFVDFLKKNKDRGVGICFPPTYKGGYEKIFSFVEKCFRYEHASYNVFDPKKAGDVFRELLDGGRNLIYCDREFKELDGWLEAKVDLGQGKHPVYIYSSVSRDKGYYIERKKNTKDSKIRIVPADYSFGRDTIISVEPCLVSDVNYYKAFYMADKVNYTTGGDLGLVFKADGLAFGFASFSKRLSSMSQIFMQSDFVVSSKTKKLSKLLIMLVKSHDVRMIIARKLVDYYDGVKTTVYTKSPVSMKYRGVFDLERRDEGKLMYSAKFIDDGIKNIYEQWRRKYAK